MTANISNLDLVNIKAFGQILSISSKDIESKQHFDINQEPQL